MLNMLLYETYGKSGGINDNNNKNPLNCCIFFFFRFGVYLSGKTVSAKFELCRKQRIVLWCRKVHPHLIWQNYDIEKVDVHHIYRIEPMNSLFAHAHTFPKWMRENEYLKKKRTEIWMLQKLYVGVNFAWHSNHN